MTVDQIKEQYEARIIAIMKSIGETAKARGFVACEPMGELGDEEYSWIMVVDKANSKFGLTFTILEELVREGDGKGIAFSLVTVNWNSKVVDDLCPFNYTPELWVNPNDSRAVEERFKLLEDASQDALLDLIQEACSWGDD